MKNDRKGVLASLSRLTAINNQSVLWLDYDEEYLRFVSNFRVQLLIEWKMYREALAWVCLENELYPDNLNAFVLKESLKSKIHNIPKKEKTTSSVGADWKGVAGMFQLKAMINRDIIIPSLEKELYQKFKIPLPNGFLFYGPPGCGKTFFARKIAEQIGFNFIEIKPSDVASTYVHGTQLAIKKLFEDARAKAPVVLFIDEMDALAPSRYRNDISFHYKAEVNELLAQLDSKQNDGLIIIGATNYIHNIDDPVLRPGRIDKKIFIGPPDMKSRAEAFKLFIGDYPHKNLRYDIMAEMSEFFTFAEIELLVTETKRSALQSKLPLSTDYICARINSFHPKLNSESISNYFN